MESIGYVLAYFSRGSLPWQGLRANTKKQKYQKIMDKKMAVSIHSLCKDTPDELRKYLDYCRSLRFEDKPNYAYLRQLFKEAIDSGKYGDPNQELGFDWMKMSSRASSAGDSGAPAGDSQAVEASGTGGPARYPASGGAGRVGEAGNMDRQVQGRNDENIYVSRAPAVAKDQFQ